MKGRFVFFSIFAVLAGCASLGQPRFQIAVDSLASPVAQQARAYILLPGNPGVTGDDLQFQEYASYLNRVLASRGFVAAQDPSSADVAVILTYGIGDPKTEQFSYSLPVWGQTGVSSGQTYGTATTYGNQTTYSATTNYTPTYGVTGFTQNTGTVTTYFRYAQITGYDFKAFRATGKQTQLWQTTVASTGTSSDLRRVFPILIGASAQYIATNTGKQVELVLRENDKPVLAVKRQ